MLTDKEIAAIEALKVGNEDHPMAKFCVEPRGWYRQAEAIAVELGLTDCGLRVLRICDLGSGFGYFVRACYDLGHNVVGVDLPDIPMIRRANDILGNRFVSGSIGFPVTFPGDMETVDLVTMFGVNLRNAHGSYWTANEYASLTRDILSRLDEGGRFVIRPNYPMTWNTPQWERTITDFAAVEHTANTITVRPK